jgi:hypothetical protein
MEKDGSNSEARIINYKDISPRNMGEKMILGNPEFNTLLDRIDLEYILGVVKHVYILKVHQIHILAYRKPYPDYIDIMYPYSISFKFSHFMLFNG